MLSDSVVQVQMQLSYLHQESSCLHSKHNYSSSIIQWYTVVYQWNPDDSFTASNDGLIFNLTTH